MEKTNAMRQFDRKKLSYAVHTYDGVISGVNVAAFMGQDPDKVFKTLVTTGKSGGHYVFMIPVAQELDLKKAAKAVGEKSVEMIHVKDINTITGYIRGGCTAIGMKKQYVTRIDESAGGRDRIIVSGGRIGSQIELAPADLAKAARAEFADLIKK
jgi:Cys-tRNA(Pro)/Cys-tRNA(Cys) deacylase